MTLSALTCQYTLVKASVACAQYRATIPSELGGNPQPGRHHVPCEQRAKTVDDVSGFTAIEADCGDVWTDGAGMVEPDTSIDCQPISDRHAIGHKQGRGDELSAIVRRSLGDGLKRRPVVVDVPDAGRND